MSEKTIYTTELKLQNEYVLELQKSIENEGNRTSLFVEFNLKSEIYLTNKKVGWVDFIFNDEGDVVEVCFSNEYFFANPNPQDLVNAALQANMEVLKFIESQRKITLSEFLKEVK